MLRALYSSAAGMQSQQVNLDVISNNLANVSTTGYKKSKAEFQDLLYETSRTAGADQGAGNQLPTSIQIGHGSQLVATPRVFTAGDMVQTGERLDVAIQGDGFLEVQLPDGTKAYTRDGALKTDSTGRVVTSEGYAVQGWPQIPSTTANITISTTGEVSITSSTGAVQTTRVQLARFANPAGLNSIGGNLFKETQGSGTVELGNPGENGFGTLNQHALEKSNVNVVEEMVNLILAQRAYEVNSKAVQASDEMMQMSNNLQRG